MKNKLLILLTALTMICFSIGVFTACNEPESAHVHEYTQVFVSDATHHWKQCSCGDKIDVEEHKGGTATCTSKGICEDCERAYGTVKQHAYDTPVVLENTHYYECVCGDKTQEQPHEYIDGVCECGKGKPHVHAYTKIGIGEYEHWDECSCEDKINIEQHEYVDGFCKCGKQEPHQHEYDTMAFDQEHHWFECVCGDKIDIEIHHGGSSTCKNLATCVDCLQSYGSLLEHDWNNGELTKAPTQSAGGIITYTCESCLDKKTENVAKGTKVTTRADLEKAIVELAWSYYAKGAYVQYDSQSLTAVSIHNGGEQRSTKEVAPEYGTKDQTIYAVCTAYPAYAYLNSIGHRIAEKVYYPGYLVTDNYTQFSDNQVEEVYYWDGDDENPITDSDRDMAIARWIDYDGFVKGESENYVRSLDRCSVLTSSAFYDWYKDGKLELRKVGDTYKYYLNDQEKTPEQVKELFLANFFKKVGNEYVNLRPGDILTNAPHTLVYLGNGIVLDCGGDKYSTSSGVDYKENTGAIFHRYTPEDTLTTYSYVVTRPLDYYAYDYDGDPGNDIIMFEDEVIEPLESALTRQEFPMMNIDRTVDVTQFGTVAKGDTLTYSIKITNKTNDVAYKTYRGNGYDGQDYKGLTITERIPNGTTFLFASNGAKPINDLLTWTINVPAGKTVEITFTVKVDAPIGSQIVCDGGFVGKVASNSITNRVGGAKLTAQQLETLTNIANSSTSDWPKKYGKNTDFIEKVYAEMGISIDLPTIEEIVANLFTPTVYNNIPSLTITRGAITSPIAMYTPQKTVSAQYQQVKNMLIDGYYGGYRMFDFDHQEFVEQGRDLTKQANKSILNFSFDFLEPGDVLFYAEANDRSNTGTLATTFRIYKIYIYVGNQTLMEMWYWGYGQRYTGADALAIIEKALIANNDIFFAIRPTQAGILPVHEWDDGVVTPATCDTDGQILYTCKGCANCTDVKQTKVVVIPKFGHTWELPMVDNKDGLTHTRKCLVDGCNLVESVDHVWGKGVLTDEDQYQFTCVDCGATKVSKLSLPQKQLDILSELTYDQVDTDGVQNTPLIYVDNIYKAMGTDGLISTVGGAFDETKGTVASFCGYVFSRLEDPTGQTTSSYNEDYRQYAIRDGVNIAHNEISKMVIKDFYGGTWLRKGGYNSQQMTNAVSEKGLNIQMLIPGDVLFLAHGNSTQQRCVWMAVYQGEGKFLVGAYHSSSIYGINNVPTSFRGMMTFDVATGALLSSEFNFTLAGEVTDDTKITKALTISNFTDLLTHTPMANQNWDYFVAIRPIQNMQITNS